MRKLITTCTACGQRMTVPLSATGRMGKCPTCGTVLKISGANSQRQPAHNRQPMLLPDDSPAAVPATVPPPMPAPWHEARQAERLFAEGRYAEALVWYEQMLAHAPRNEVLTARREACLRALRRPMSLPAALGARDAKGKLAAGTVRGVIAARLAHSLRESSQLRAADLAARLLGMYAPESAAAAPAPTEDNGARKSPEASSGQEGRLSAEVETPGKAEQATDQTDDTAHRSGAEDRADAPVRKPDRIEPATGDNAGAAHGSPSEQAGGNSLIFGIRDMLAHLGGKR